MKKLTTLLLVFTSFAFANAQVSLETLRKEYSKVPTDSEACASLYQKISASSSSDNLINGYKGAITTAMAGHATNKAQKLKLFTAGKKSLEQAIKNDSSNIELRFLRFTVQMHAPKALGYNKDITADKHYILMHFDSVKSSVLKSKMSEYLLSSGNLSEAEKQKIRSAAN